MREMERRKRDKRQKGARDHGMMGSRLVVVKKGEEATRPKEQKETGPQANEMR